MQPDTRQRIRGSLRLRLIAGAVAIALVAVFSALLAAYGAAKTADLIERSTNAQWRMDLLASLSARVSDYAVIAVETSGASVPEEARQARLLSATERVEAAFSAVGTALESAVAEGAGQGETEQMRRATRSLVLARMQARFAALQQSVLDPEQLPALRAHLDGFATQFSPLLNEAIAEERRDRDSAAQAVAAVRDRLISIAIVAGLLAALLTVAFYWLLVRPIIRQLSHIRQAAEDLGQGDFDIDLPERRDDELGWVAREINQTAASLKGREDQINADRARLNEIIEDRTAELSDANAQLSRVDTERRRFFADIGHELRTPLTVILAEAELGRKSSTDPEQLDAALSVIHARARRLNRRIDDLLRVARSESGRIELAAETFDLDRAAADAVEDMAPLAKRRGVALVPTLTRAACRGDRDWCRQIISGLIENAVKNSPSGSVIEITCQAEEDLAILSVTDEGQGLDEAGQAQVFERFARGARNTAAPGFGVGLALARWVIEQQAGVIELISPAPRPPKGGTSGRPGAQLVMTLPLTEPAVQIAHD
jgi:signal transduction histidine kinase